MYKVTLIIDVVYKYTLTTLSRAKLHPGELCPTGVTLDK